MKKIEVMAKYLRNVDVNVSERNLARLHGVNNN